MSTVEVRALKQNASAVVADAAAGEIVTITDQGLPVAQLTAIPTSRLRSLIEAGRARQSRHNITELPAPDECPAVSTALADMRDAELRVSNRVGRPIGSVGR